MKVIIIALCLLLVGCRANDSSNANQASDQTSGSNELPVGDAEERLAVAAKIRSSLRGQATVVVNGTKLVVSYKSVSMDEAPETFIKQQGKDGMARIANAGFETLIISDGDSRTKEIPVAQYRTK